MREIRGRRSARCAIPLRPEGRSFPRISDEINLDNNRFNELTERRRSQLLGVRPVPPTGAGTKGGDRYLYYI